MNKSRGFTLIELLVATAIGLGLTLAITVMLIRSESSRRTLTSVSDAANNGAYLAFALDRTLRSAGTGYAQSWVQTFGCPLRVERDGTQLLPRSGAFPPPFASVATTVRMAPLVVHAGIGANGSDVLIVGTGASGLGESAQRVRVSSATSTGLRLPSTVGLRGGDLVAVFDVDGRCMVQQVAAGFVGAADQQLNFSGTYYSDVVSGVPLADMSMGDAWVAPLGNVNGNRPAFQLLGVGDNNTLFSFDLLQLDGGTAAVPVADSVSNLRARYGLDTNADGRIDSWVDPAAADWSAATLLDGSAVSRNRLSQIVAVRLAVVVRNTTPERSNVTAATLPLFADMDTSLRVSLPVAAADRLYRFRVLEFTVPLRNVMLKP